MVYGRYNYSFHGVYKPTNKTGGHHPVRTWSDSFGTKTYMVSKIGNDVGKWPTSVLFVGLYLDRPFPCSSLCNVSDSTLNGYFSSSTHTYWTLFCWLMHGKCLCLVLYKGTNHASSAHQVKSCYSMLFHLYLYVLPHALRSSIPWPSQTWCPEVSQRV